MSTATLPPGKGVAARRRILDAALKLFRQKGYAATRVEDVCAEAGLTKGGFFHHFAGKEDLAVAAAEHWSAVTGGLFESAPYHALPDPYDRILGYIEFRKAILAGGTDEFTCLAGTLAQETHLSSPAISAAAGASIFGHAATLVADIAAAKAARCSGADWTPESLAQFTQAALQGAFILAKAQGGPGIARDMVDHLKRYVILLFNDKKS
ncbi:MAG: TetR/AcrR family transcriptional regulator [Phyllobacteriaceae bacterium]|nr:TetR/AcrR family transcriptional regulator [Phyllobacteriaceae bacterium]